MDISVDLSPKQLREAMCLAQSRVVGAALSRSASDAIQMVINECDRHRPLGPDGKHGETRHTLTCGCADKGPCRYEMKDIQGVDVMMCRVHDRNSKHDVSGYPFQPCLAVDPWENDAEPSNPKSHVSVVHHAINVSNDTRCGVSAPSTGDRMTPFVSQVTCPDCLRKMHR